MVHEFIYEFWGSKVQDEGLRYFRCNFIVSIMQSVWAVLSLLQESVAGGFSDFLFTLARRGRGDPVDSWIQWLLLKYCHSSKKIQARSVRNDDSSWCCAISNTKRAYRDSLACWPRAHQGGRNRHASRHTTRCVGVSVRMRENGISSPIQAAAHREEPEGVQVAPATFRQVPTTS